MRTVPVPEWVKNELDEWLIAAAVHRGRLFRRVNKAGRAWGEGLTEKAVWHIVKEVANRVGVPKLAPHDLRRSATHPEVNWNRFSSYWDTFRFRRRNATLVVSKGSGRRSMIESES